MELQSMGVIRAVLDGATSAVGIGSTSPLAVDFDVSAFDAWQAAVKRGWGFKCYDVGNLGMTINITTCPPHSIGCVIKSPPVTTDDKLVYATFSRHSTGTAPSLGNGWSVEAFEVEGTQCIKGLPFDEAF